MLLLASSEYFTIKNIILRVINLFYFATHNATMVTG
jgi:hypothetical protein